jgi:aryl-alcohol dehydrogenase-like predicted oxidoreductase
MRLGIAVSRLGIGGWPLGGGARRTHPSDEDDMRRRTLAYALERGLNWIDVAPLYGFGHAERLVGSAVASLDVRPHIFTKCGFAWDDRGRVTQTLRAAVLEREVEESLARLQCDVLDLVQIHWPVPDEELEEGWDTLARLKRAGKVLHIGVCNVTVPHLERLEAIAPVETVQLSYSLIERSAATTIIPYCQSRGISVFAHSPLATGMLAGQLTPEVLRTLPDHDHRRELAHFRMPALAANIKIVENLWKISANTGLPVATLALAWSIRHGTPDGVIVGFRVPAHVDEALMALTQQIDERVLNKI